MSIGEEVLSCGFYGKIAKEGTRLLRSLAALFLTLCATAPPATATAITATHSSQRRNRWLLWVAVLVLAVGGNRWVASCQRVHPVVVPAGEVRVALRSACSWQRAG